MAKTKQPTQSEQTQLIKAYAKKIYAQEKGAPMNAQQRFHNSFAEIHANISDKYPELDMLSDGFFNSSEGPCGFLVEIQGIQRVIGGLVNHMKFFSFAPEDGFSYHENAEAAKAEAERIIGSYRENAVGYEWDPDVEHICWGEVRESTRAYKIPIPDGSSFDEFWEYALMP